MTGNSAGQGSSAAHSIIKFATAGRGLLAAVKSGKAGGESGGASAAKLFLASVGDSTVGRRIAPCGGVVRNPLAAVTVMKSVRSLSVPWIPWWHGKRRTEKSGYLGYSTIYVSMVIPPHNPLCTKH